MLLQVETLSDAVEACAAFLQCHTAAKAPLTPAFVGTGHSVAVTQRCLNRCKERQPSGTVLHEQPTPHATLAWCLLPPSSSRVWGSLHHHQLLLDAPHRPVQEFGDLCTTTSSCWTHLIVQFKSLGISAPPPALAGSTSSSETTELAMMVVWGSLHHHQLLLDAPHRPVQEFGDLCTTTSSCWKHLIVRDNRAGDDGSLGISAPPPALAGRTSSSETTELAMMVVLT